MEDQNQQIIDYLYAFVYKTLEEVPEYLHPLYYLMKAQWAIYNCSGTKDEAKPFEDMVEKIKSRMKVGLERYGHGLRIHDDTRQWGTRENSWLEMCEEEVLDGIVYSIAHHLRAISDK